VWALYSSEGGQLQLTAYVSSNNGIASITTVDRDPMRWGGNNAIVSHFDPASDTADTPTDVVHRLEIEGDGLFYDPGQVYGPVYFAQYTVHAGVLKLSAQLAPVEPAATTCSLYFRRNGAWSKTSTSVMHPMARVASFRIEGW